MTAARLGDPEAWDQLVRRFQRPLFAYVQGLLRNEQASLDVVQESFIQSVHHLARLREDQKFGSWLFRIAHQKCLQHWRRQGREMKRQEAIQDQPDETPVRESPVDRLVRKEEEAWFLERLAQLSDDHRAIILLHIVEGFSLDDIAGITGVPTGTVKSRLHHAKKQLRQHLEMETNQP